MKSSLQRPIVPVLVMASAAMVIGLAAFGGVIAGHDRLTAESLNAGATMAHVEGLEYVSSSTVKDWAAVADVVVVAEATAERALPRTHSETVAGSGSDLIGRAVTVEPTSTIWVSPTNTRELPASIDLGVLGWLADADDREGSRKLASLEGSRIEVGHTYVLGLKWMRAECGEDPEPAQWAVFGSGAALPLDNGVLGIGEIAGRVVDDVNALYLIPNTVLEDLAGQPATALGDALEAVQNVVQRIPFYEVEPPRC